MTLEEIYRRMKQNNQYYEGSQAQKEEQAGMNIEGDTVKHTEKSAQIHQDYVENQPTFNTFITGAPTYKEQLKDNFIQIKRRTKNLEKNFISGVGNGIRGIMDVPFQETENNLKKGENSNKNLWQHILKSTAYTLNPNVSFIDNIISSNKNATNILKDKNKSGYEKVANIVTDGVTNVVDTSTTGKKGLDASIELLGKLSQNNSEKISDKVQNVQNKVDEPFKKYDEKVQKDNNNFGNVEKFLFNVSNSLGNMAPSIVASAVTKNPNIGLATMGYSVKGQSTEEAREKGQELQKAIDIGNTKGAIEVGTELLTGGLNIFGKGALDDVISRGIDKKVRNQVLNFLTKKGYEFAGEIGEETISDVLGTMIDKGTTDPNIKYSIKDWGDTALTTMLSTAVLNALGGGYTKSAYNQNIEKKIDEDIVKENISSMARFQLPRYTTNVPTNNIIPQNNNKMQVQPTKSNQIISDTKPISKERLINKVNQVQSLDVETKELLIKTINETYSNEVLKNIENDLKDFPVIKQVAPVNNSAAVNKFNGYTQKEINNLRNSNKISIANNENDIVNFAKKSKVMPGNFKLYVGKIINETAEKIKNKIGINVNGYNISLKTDAIRHAYNKHSSETEILRGQVPITDEDFANIPKVINDPDDIINSGINQQGQQAISFEKNINGNNVVVTYVSNKHKTLELQSYYKFKNNKKIDSFTATNETNSPVRTSKTNSDTNLYTNIISQNDNKMQVQPIKTDQNIVQKEINSTQNKDITLNDNTIQDTKESVAKILDKPIKLRTEKENVFINLMSNFVDKGTVFENLSKKTNNRDLEAKWDTTLLSQSKAQYAIGNSREYTNKQGEKVKVKALTDIIDEVGKDAGAFQNYMYHQLNVDRMTLEDRYGGDTGTNYENPIINNKPVFGESVTADISRSEIKILEKKYPKFREYAEDVYNYLRADKQQLVDSGVISKELSEIFDDMYPHYVPISRVIDNNSVINVPLDTRKTGVNTPIKRAKGGSVDLQPMFEVIAGRTMQTYRASDRNAFGLELKNTLKKANMLNESQENTNVEKIIDEIGNEYNTDVVEGKVGANPTFTVFDNGEKVTYEISQDMYNALKPRDQQGFMAKTDRTIGKVLSKISDFRRGVLTEYNPVFSLTNAIKDAQDVLLNSQHAGKTYLKFGEAYQQILRKGSWYKEYLANGGEQNSYFKDGEFENTKKAPTTKKAISIPLNAISRVNNVIEMAPRLAEYIVSREQGKSIQTSMLDASRVTTNFKAGGDITKFANRNGVTFLNASIQGLAQNIRNIREANQKGIKGYTTLLGKTVVAGLPAIILNGLIWGGNSDDDKEYAELSDYVKNNYYIVGKVGDTFIRIPKGRTVAVIQKMMTNIQDYVNDKKEINVDNFTKDFWDTLDLAKSNLAPNNPLENNVLSPIINVAQNKTWYGDDLVPKRLQKEHPEDQYDESTDAFSRWLGKTMGWSPIKINYLLDQYGGGVSDIILPMSTPQAEDTNIFTDKFTADSVMKNGNAGKFYNLLDKIDNSSKANDTDKVKYKYASAISKELGELYNKKRSVQNSNLTDDAKKIKIKEIQKEINLKSKKAVEIINNYNLKGNITEIGGDTYYKVAKDGEITWQKATDNDLKVINENEIEKENAYIYITKIKDIEGNKGTDDKVISGSSNANKAKYIMDMDTNDDQKDKLLSLLSDTDTAPTVSDLKKLNGEYLTYMQQSGKKQDGVSQRDKYMMYIDAGIPVTTLNKYYDEIGDIEGIKGSNGKTVSGSKKKALFNYINSLSLNTTQKKILFTKCNSSYGKNYKSEIHAYINSLNISKTRKEQIWSELYD